MIRVSLALLAVLVLSLSAAEAKVFRLGVPPVAEVTLPDAWGPEETDNGVEANSPVGKIYMSFEVHPFGNEGDGMGRAMRAAVEWVRERGAQLDRFTPPVEGRFNKWTAVRATASGRDNDGEPTSVEVIGVPLNATTALIFFGCYETGAERANAPTLAAIIESVRPVGR
jgi:hypothetical protein